MGIRPSASFKLRPRSTVKRLSKEAQNHFALDKANTDGPSDEHEQHAGSAGWRAGELAVCLSETGFIVFHLCFWLVSEPLPFSTLGVWQAHMK